MIEENNELKNKIFEDLMLKKDDLDIYGMIKEVLKYYAQIIPFKEPDPNNMLEEAEEDVYPCDTRLFSQYIDGIESKAAPLVNQYEGDDIAIKFDYKNKECIMGITYEEYTPYEDSEFNYLNSTVIVPISSEKRLHIGTYEDYLNKKVIDYNDKLDEYDSKYGEEYQDYFSDKINKIKDIENFSKPMVKYNFSELDKMWFLELLEKFGGDASIVMFYGYLIIDVSVPLNNNLESNILKIIDFVQFINNVIEKFENV